MNFYLASGFSRRDSLRTLAYKLQRLGHQVKSGWIQYNERPDRDSPEWEQFATKVAAENLIDLSMSDALIIDAFGIRESNNGGVHTELGYALAKDWPIFLIGPRRNTFTWLPQVRHVPTEEDLLAIL